MKRSGLNTAMLMALIGGGLAGCSHNCYDRGEGCFSGSSSGSSTSVSTKGTVVDGYVAGADVYLANADGSCSSTVAGTTDANGNYTLTVAAPNGICASGGTDLSTGKALVGTLQAPAGSTVVTPLTTMFAYALKSNPNLSESAFATSLGLTLTPGQSLLTLDPLAPGAPSNLEQVGAAIQALIASIATSLGGSANAGAVYGDVVSAVLTAVSSGSVNLATLAASGNFSSIAASVATQAQTNVASDPSLTGNTALLSAVAAISPAQLSADANAAASSASQSSASNAPPPAAFTELAGVSANGTVTGTVQPVETTTPAYDSALTIHGAFNSVTFTLATATGNALVSDTGNVVTIAVASLVSGKSTQNLTVSIPTSWSEVPSNNGTITPAMPSGSVLTVSGTRSDGTTLTATLPAATVTADGTLTTSAGSVTLNLAQLYSDLSSKNGPASNNSLALLAGYNDGTGTTAGKSYVITTTLPGLALKTVESSTSSPAPTFSYTTEVVFD